jgi:DNA-binding transcriptional ArsR family regulator
MKHYATILTAMANFKRLEILEKLIDGEFAVNELASEIGLSQSALSQHLAKLRAAKLVSTRRDAQTIYYSSDSTAAKAVLAALDEAVGKSAPLHVVAKKRSNG